MNLLNKIKHGANKAVAFAIIATPSLALADGVAGINKNLVAATKSFGPLISIAAFVVGMAALFKAVTTIMNHSENPRENPLKNVVFFGLAAAIGLGYTFTSTAVIQTLFETDKSDVVDKTELFEVKKS